jgi:hypothetical protein
MVRRYWLRIRIRCGKKWSWPNFKTLYRHLTEGLREITKPLGQDILPAYTRTGHLQNASPLEPNWSAINLTEKTLYLPHTDQQVLFREIIAF